MTAAVIVNAETGEQERRPLTDAEQKQRGADQAALAAAQRDRDQAASARAAARERLRTATTVTQLRDALDALLP